MPSLPSKFDIFLWKLSFSSSPRAHSIRVRACLSSPIMSQKINLRQRWQKRCSLGFLSYLPVSTSKLCEDKSHLNNDLPAASPNVMCSGLGASKSGIMSRRKLYLPCANEDNNSSTAFSRHVSNIYCLQYFARVASHSKTALFPPNSSRIPILSKRTIISLYHPLDCWQDKSFQCCKADCSNVSPLDSTLIKKSKANLAASTHKGTNPANQINLRTTSTNKTLHATHHRKQQKIDGGLGSQARPPVPQ